MSRRPSPEECAACVAAVRDATDAKSRVASAWAMALAARARVKRSLLMDAGAAPALAAALRDWDHAKAKEHCADAVYWLACDFEPQAALAEAGVLEPLVEFMPHVNQNGFLSATLALHHLASSNPEILQQLREVPGVMEALEAVEDDDQGGYAALLLDELRPLAPSGRLVKPARGVVGAAAAGCGGGGGGASAAGAADAAAGGAAAAGSGVFRDEGVVVVVAGASSGTAAPDNDATAPGNDAGAGEDDDDDDDDADGVEGPSIADLAAEAAASAAAVAADASAPTCAPSDAARREKVGAVVEALRAAGAKEVAAQRQAAGWVRALTPNLTCVDLLIAAGAVPVLLAALGEWKDGVALGDVAFSLAMMARSSRPRQCLLVESGILAPLPGFFWHVSKTGALTAPFVLCRLIEDNPEVAQRVRDDPAVMEALSAAAAAKTDTNATVLFKHLSSLPSSGRSVKAAMTSVPAQPT